MNNIRPIKGAVGLRGRKSRVAGWVLMAFIAAGNWGLAAEAATPAAGCGSETVEEKWGIQVSSLHLSAHGYMVDFRYKVLDPKKAATLGDPKAKPYLIDQATGVKLFVPRSPKVGPLRQSAESLTAGKVYFTLFSNRNKAVKAGSKVTVVVGEFRAENLVVQ